MMSSSGKDSAEVPSSSGCGLSTPSQLHRLAADFSSDCKNKIDEVSEESGSEPALRFKDPEARALFKGCFESLDELGSLFGVKISKPKIVDFVPEPDGLVEERAAPANLERNDSDISFTASNNLSMETLNR